MSQIKSENVHVDISTITPKFFRKNTIKDGSLSQIYGANQNMPEISLVAQDGRQIGPWVKCKDFIQDVFWSQFNKVNYEIYGYRYNPTVEPAPFDPHFALALRWKGHDKAELTVCATNIGKTLVSLETSIPWFKEPGTKAETGIPENLRSTVVGPNADGIIMVFGNRVWKRSIANISFFTWLVRSAFNNTSGELDDVVKGAPNKKDVYYYNSAKRYIASLRKSGPQNFAPDFLTYSSIHEVHNNGFVKWSGGSGF